MKVKRVEIAICTWNRDAELAVTLERFAELKPHWKRCKEVAWRVIVVDNNSTDQTASVVEKFQGKLDLVYAHEPEQGHVMARNRAVDLAEGDLLLWTDDDVTVSEDWGPQYVEAADSQTESVFWGSQIVPRFEGRDSPPGWIQSNWSKLSGCFAERDLGNVGFVLNQHELPYGANFAIRTDVQRQYRYGSQFGRAMRDVVGEDELELFRRLLSAGFEGRWIPNAPVYHRIDRARMTTDFIARYFEGQGRILVAKGQAWTNNTAELQRESRHELFCYKTKRWFSPSDVWLSHLIRGSLAKGQWQAIENQSPG